MSDIMHAGTKCNAIRVATLFTFLFQITCFSQNPKGHHLKGKPQDLEACYLYLDDIFDFHSKYTFQVFPERIAVTRLHDSLGRWIRNEWGLWRNSDLKKYFVSIGITDADDMSTIILTSYHRRLNSKAVKLEDQIRLLPSKTNTLRDWSQQIQEEIKELETLLVIGDTVMIGIYAPEKRLFQTYATSVTAYGVIEDRWRARIVKMEPYGKRIPINKVGDVVSLDPFSLILIPPRK